MCEFISWIEVKKDGEKHILHLDDELLFTERSHDLLKSDGVTKDNDFIGHHAIRLVMQLKQGEGEEGEVRDFWNAEKLPKELRPKLKDFSSLKKHFGKMFSECAQPDDLQYLIKYAPKSKEWKGLKEYCEGLLKTSLLRGVTTEKLAITARYDLTIDQLVKLAKFNGYINPDVSDKHFKEKKRPSEKREAVLVKLPRTASTEEVEAVIKELELESGNVKELLSVAIDHPQQQEESPIVELGSVWQVPSGYRDVAYLDRWDVRRELSLDWRGHDWDDCYRFLAFRKVS